MWKTLENYLPDHTRLNLVMKGLGISKIPLLFASGAKITNVDSKTCRVRMPFRKIVKNHLGSVYFGALAIGADACVGFLAQYKIMKRSEKISIVFKDFEAQFLKRAEGPVDFVCDQGELIDQLIDRAISTQKRAHEPIPAYAEVDGEKVAEFTLTLSIKVQ